MTLFHRLLPLAALAASGAAIAAPAYTSAGTVALGAPDRWDYVVADRVDGRVYVAHGDRLTVVDGRAGKVVGDVMGIPGGTHGTGVVPHSTLAVTDEGQAAQAVVFDRTTMKIVRRIKAGEDADGIAVDPVSGHVFILNGDAKSVTVLDATKDTALATIALGETPEYGATDGNGTLFVAGAGLNDLVKVTLADNSVQHMALPDCTKPHGLAVDARAHRVFVGCVNNRLIVVNGDTGAAVAQLTIGRGSDAVAFDSSRKRVFSSNGRDGTISVFQQTTPDAYTALDPIPTRVSARTMDVDAQTGRVFVVGGDSQPAATPGGRPSIKAGSLALMMFDPAS